MSGIRNLTGICHDLRMKVIYRIKCEASECRHSPKVYRENCWDVISVGEAVTSVALVVYFGDWIKAFVKLNLVVLLLLVQAVYVGIRAYVKGCKRARGYY